ncbi:MAG: SCO family protein [Burkholderiales bacterium]
MKTFSKLFVVIAFFASGLSTPVFCAEPEDAVTMHDHHHMMQMMEKTTSQMVEYKLPQVQLVRNDGKTVSFADELNDGRPVLMNFMYTSCTTTCSLASHTLSELQDKLGDWRNRIHIVSVSVDPEQDTPAVLTKYAQKFSAGKEWDFYTGTLEASIAAQQAFNVYRGDKMQHNPVTLIRSAPGKPWLRIEGFAKSDELLHNIMVMETTAEAQPAKIEY